MRSPARRVTHAGMLVLCLLGLLALAPAMAPAGAAPARRAGASTLLGGINITGVDEYSRPAEADRDISWAKKLHAKLVRLEIPWSAFEPHAAGQVAPGPLAYTDRLVSDAAAAGIRIIMMAESTPCWASSAPASLLRKCAPGRTDAASSWPPSRPGDFAAFAAFLAQRYGRQLAAIEVWNEPDQINQHYFAGPHKPERYAAILRAAYPAIKRADPNVLVLGGSIVGSNGRFLQLLYAAGIKGYYDALAVHYYHLTLASVRSIHEVQLANGDHTPLWLDEFGWSSCWPATRSSRNRRA